MSEDLHSLAHDLAAAPAKVQRNALAVVEHGAVNVKKDWSANARESSGHHAPAYPDSISYDSGMSVPGAIAGDIAFEIGPDKSKRQGPLGNILEFGSPHSAPHNDGGRALDAEAPRFEKAIADAAVEALGWH